MKQWMVACLVVMASAAWGQDALKDIGVYVRNGEQWVKLSQLNSSGFKSSGMGKVMLTGGIASAHSIMLFRDSSAPISISSPRPSFLIVGPVNSPRDIVIVRLDQKKDHRELQIGSFNGYTGGGMSYRKEDVAEVDVKDGETGLLVNPKGDLRPGEYIIFANSPTVLPVGYGGYDLEIK